MSPPIRDGSGNSIGSIRLGDGSEISEVRTGAGDVVFSASAIPDITMFQSPIYHWWAGEGLGVSDGNQTNGWIDNIADLEATDVGNPIYREDESGFQAVSYDGSGDGHNFDPSTFPSGDDPVSWAALIYVPTGLSDQELVLWGSEGNDDFSVRLRDDETFRFNLSGAGTDVTISFDTGQWITVGGSYEGGTDGLLKAYHNTDVSSGSNVTANIVINEYSLAYNPLSDNFHSEVFISEFIFSDANEDDKAYLDFHDDRLA